MTSGPSFSRRGVGSRSYVPRSKEPLRCPFLSSDKGREREPVTLRPTVGTPPRSDTPRVGVEGHGPDDRFVSCLPKEALGTRKKVCSDTVTTFPSLLPRTGNTHVVLYVESCVVLSRPPVSGRGTVRLLPGGVRVFTGSC